MFDVDLKRGESYRESATFRPGERATLATTPWGRLGMTVCYDVRFAYLYRALAQAGAAFLTVPAAFTRPTGQAHRSEEHTSELQSLMRNSYAVFCLKKKKANKTPKKPPQSTH